MWELECKQRRGDNLLNAMSADIEFYEDEMDDKIKNLSNVQIEGMDDSNMKELCLCITA